MSDGTRTALWAAVIGTGVGAVLTLLGLITGKLPAMEGRMDLIDEKVSQTQGTIADHEARLRSLEQTQ